VHSLAHDHLSLEQFDSLSMLFGSAARILDFMRAGMLSPMRSVHFSD